MCVLDMGNALYNFSDEYKPCDYIIDCVIYKHQFNSESKLYNFTLCIFLTIHFSSAVKILSFYCLLVILIDAAFNNRC